MEKLEKLRPQCQTTDDIYAVTTFQALCCSRLQLHHNAIELYQIAMQMRPNSLLASNLGNCYSELGLLEESISCYFQAIELDTQNIFPYNNLAQLYIQMGQYSEAIDYAKQALNINSKMPEALSAMAISSYMLGDTEAYENYYRLAVSNGYDGEALKNYIKFLDSNIE